MSPSAADRAAAARGIAWMVLAAVGYSVNAGLVRHLSADLDAFAIVFWRSLVATLFLLPVLLRHARAGARTAPGRWPLYLLRGVLTYLAMSATYYALGHMPIADVYALQFTLPIFSILGTVLVLGERAGPGTWAACAVGFAGTLVILRPGMEVVSSAALIALSSAAFYGATNVVIKLLARTESTTAITLYGNLIMLPLSALPLLVDWQWPPVHAIGWIVALGVFTTLGQWALTRAIATADARVVWPFDFLRLPFTAIIGYAAFAQVPGAETWVGALIIFGAAYSVIRREAVAR